jgi:NAD(P)-dependent dehydrogenase (short-subunit alcohol dehydrogenase family)
LFGEYGAYMGLLARNEERLEDARKEIEAAGGRALALPTDVADHEQVEAAAQRVEEELGPIDIRADVAMITIFSPLKDITPEEFKRATEVTYLGYVYGTMSALKRILPRDRSTIGQVGSALSYRGIPLQAAYRGAKFGIRGFTDSVRTEVRHQGSNVHVTEGMVMPEELSRQVRRMPRESLIHSVGVAGVSMVRAKKITCGGRARSDSPHFRAATLVGLA